MDKPLGKQLACTLQKLNTIDTCSAHTVVYSYPQVSCGFPCGIYDTTAMVIKHMDHPDVVTLLKSLLCVVHRVQTGQLFHLVLA